ncbi:MAG TPA: cobyrinic acid a,c-diamide synthase [Candidatus Sericytochromatia bacterium]
MLTGSLIQWMIREPIEMDKPRYNNVSNIEQIKDISFLENVPLEVRKWVESLPLNKRRYALFLCYLICTAPTESQAELLDTNIADGLISKMVQDRVLQQLVKKYLKNFHIEKELSDAVLKSYVKQFHVHTAQDLRTQPDLYLEFVLRLTDKTEERNNLFNYILGFEILKMIFQMSWLQHERLYRLQKNQDSFLKTYIKPIQYTHRINGIIVPKHEHIFFAKKNYFVKEPNIKEKKLNELVMATFTKDTVTQLGFIIIHHLNYLVFDYDYIFNPEPEGIFI